MTKPLIAEFTHLHKGSTVSFTQRVTGRAVNIANGMDVWLLIHPVLARSYWPQRGPLLFGPHGQFHALAYFGLDAATYKGEKFILMLVEAPRVVSQQYFGNDPLSVTLQQLPGGATPLAQIVVILSS